MFTPLGGMTDLVDDESITNDWGFHLTMAILFFFTVVLMLNVLIALINVAFAKGDDGWRLVWIESRLQYIESAENMSYHIPGFRQAHNWFPKEIYFTATLQEVRDYRKKHTKDKNKDKVDLGITVDWLHGAVDMDDFEDEDVDEDVNGNNGSDGMGGQDSHSEYQNEDLKVADGLDSHSEGQIDDLKVADGVD